MTPQERRVLDTPEICPVKSWVQSLSKDAYDNTLIAKIKKVMEE